MTRSLQLNTRYIMLIVCAWFVGCSADSAADVDATTQRQLPPLIKAEEHARIKVMVINFDPIVEGSNRLSKLRGSTGAAPLAQQFRGGMYGASHEGVAFDIVDWADEDFPPQADGQLTYDKHLACLNEGEACYNHRRADYTVIANTHNLCERVANREIDEVWLFGDTGFGFYESIMVGKGAFWVNADPLWAWNIFACPRPFVIMGFSYARGIFEMFHNFGHRVDSVIERATRTTVDGVDSSMAEIFVRSNATGQVAGCGNTHFPPNVRGDVEYLYNTADPWVLTECDKVGPAQNSEGKNRVINCAEWGCYELGYHMWRFGKLPRTLASNWWRQIFSTVEFKPGQAAF